MRYHEHAPPPALSRHVRCVWTLAADAAFGAAAPEPVIPDGCAEIVLNLGDPYASVVDGAEEVQPRAMVVGQITAPLLLRPTGRTRLVGIRLLPWGGPALWRAPMAELRDRWVDAGDVLPGLRELLDRLASLREEDRAGAAATFLASRLRPDSARALAPAIVRRIGASGGRTSVRQTARALHVTRRTVERVMRDSVGLAPRDFARILRVQRAIGRLRRTAQPVLGRVALEAGYYDHAHFCREFRRFTTLSPSEFLAHERALTDAFLEGASAETPWSDDSPP